MEKEEINQQKWLVINQDDMEYTVVTPTWDIEKHDLDEPSCKCQPRIETEKHGAVYDKPMLIHNSFRDQKAIDDAMNRLF